MNMKKYIPEYEKLTGKRLDSKVIRLIERLDAIGKQAENRGHEDAAHNRPVVSADVFLSWANKVFDDDPEMAEIMSVLMQGCYMEGYKGDTA